MRTLMAATACVLFLSACGVKGALYLPPASSAPADPPPAEVVPAEPASADTPEEN